MYGLISGQLNSNSSVITATSSSQIYSITLTSLQTGTQYFYRIIATNQFATRMTNEMMFLTNDISKLIADYELACIVQSILIHHFMYWILLGSGPVSELELNSINDTTLLISWGEPVSPNGNILSYSITITDLRDDSNIRRENRGAEESTSFTETNLGIII